MSSPTDNPSEEESAEGVAGVSEAMEQVVLEDGEFSLEKLTKHFNECTATQG